MCISLSIPCGLKPFHFGLILLYSDQQWNHSVSVTSTKKDSNPNVPLRIATQFLIYEIVCGLRDPYSFNRNGSNEYGTSGDIFHNAGAASLSGFSACYNDLVSAIQSAKTIPSFCGSSSGNAPTIPLSGDTGSAYDSNGVCTSLIAGPYTTNSSGNLSITGLHADTYYVKELGHTDRTIHALYTCSSTNPQKVTVTSGGTTLVTFYNKLNTGSVKLMKSTNTGANLSGWQIGLYTDTACTNPVSGSPFTTGADGTLTSGEDGILVWDNLYPGLQYRLTETKAPEGFKLLTEAAFTGTLPADTLSVELTVVNARTFTMPDTGGNTAMIFRILSMISGTVCLTMLIYSKKRLV